MPEVKADQLILLAAFVLPGAISMFIYGLLVPQKDFRLQERLLEAVCFSLMNIVLVGIPLRETLGVDAFSTGGISKLEWGGWLLIILAFVVLPSGYPFLLRRVLRWAEGRGWIQVQAKSAWDDFFGSRERGCWVQILLNDDKWVGGRFDRASFASSYPEPGHILVEELWSIDEDGRFQERLPGNPGLILRPTDYKIIRVFAGEQA